MKESVLNVMQRYVDSIMENDKRDFEFYDKNELKDYDGDFIWNVRGWGTSLYMIDTDAVVKALTESETARYSYGRAAKKHYLADYIYLPADGETFVYVNGVFEKSTPDFAKELYKDRMLEAISIYERDGGKMPENYELEVKFRCSISYVKEQLRYAEKHNDKSLISSLKRMRCWQKLSDNDCVEVYQDFADRSFTFAHIRDGRCVLNGGIIFHGYPEEGYTTGGSIQLTPSYGWQIHT